MTPLGFHLAKLPVDVLIGKVFIKIFQNFFSQIDEQV